MHSPTGGNNATSVVNLSEYPEPGQLRPSPCKNVKTDGSEGDDSCSGHASERAVMQPVSLSEPAASFTMAPVRESFLHAEGSPGGSTGPVCETLNPHPPSPALPIVPGGPPSPPRIEVSSDSASQPAPPPFDRPMGSCTSSSPSAVSCPASAKVSTVVGPPSPSTSPPSFPRVLSLENAPGMSSGKAPVMGSSSRLSSNDPEDDGSPDNVASLPPPSKVSRESALVPAGTAGHALPLDFPCDETDCSLVARALGCYTCLRTLSCFLALSPFPALALLRGLCSPQRSSLLDEIHVQLLRVLANGYRGVGGTGKLYTPRGRCRAWAYLDRTNWPVYFHLYLKARQDLSWASWGEEAEALAQAWDEDVEAVGWALSLEVAAEEWERTPVRVRVGILEWLCHRLVDRSDVCAWLGKRGLAQDMEALERSRHPDGHMDACAVCSLGGDLVLCDGCPAVYHPDCVNERAFALPTTWFCPECRFQDPAYYGARVPEYYCRVRAGKGQGGAEGEGEEVWGIRVIHGLVLRRILSSSCKNVPRQNLHLLTPQQAYRLLRLLGPERALRWPFSQLRRPPGLFPPLNPLDFPPACPSSFPHAPSSPSTCAGNTSSQTATPPSLPVTQCEAKGGKEQGDDGWTWELVSLSLEQPRPRPQLADTLPPKRQAIGSTCAQPTGVPEASCCSCKQQGRAWQVKNGQPTHQVPWKRPRGRPRKHPLPSQPVVRMNQGKGYSGRGVSRDSGAAPKAQEESVVGVTSTCRGTGLCSRPLQRKRRASSRDNCAGESLEELLQKQEGMKEEREGGEGVASQNNAEEEERMGGGIMAGEVGNEKRTHMPNIGPETPMEEASASPRQGIVSKRQRVKPRIGYGCNEEKEFSPAVGAKAILKGEGLMGKRGGDDMTEEGLNDCKVEQEGGREGANMPCEAAVGEDSGAVTLTKKDDGGGETGAKGTRETVENNAVGARILKALDKGVSGLVRADRGVALEGAPVETAVMPRDVGKTETRLQDEERRCTESEVAFLQSAEGHSGKRDEGSGQPRKRKRGRPPKGSQGEDGRIEAPRKGIQAQMLDQEENQVDERNVQAVTGNSSHGNGTMVRARKASAPSPAGLAKEKRGRGRPRKTEAGQSERKDNKRHLAKKGRGLVELAAEQIAEGQDERQDKVCAGSAPEEAKGQMDGGWTTSRSARRIRKPKFYGEYDDTAGEAGQKGTDGASARLRRKARRATSRDRKVARGKKRLRMGRRGSSKSAKAMVSGSDTEDGVGFASVEGRRGRYESHEALRRIRASKKGAKTARTGGRQSSRGRGGALRRKPASSRRRRSISVSSEEESEVHSAMEGESESEEDNEEDAESWLEDHDDSDFGSDGLVSSGEDEDGAVGTKKQRATRKGGGEGNKEREEEQIESLGGGQFDVFSDPDDFLAESNPYLHRARTLERAEAETDAVAFNPFLYLNKYRSSEASDAPRKLMPVVKGSWRPRFAFPVRVNMEVDEQDVGGSVARAIKPLPQVAHLTRLEDRAASLHLEKIKDMLLQLESELRGLLSGPWESGSAVINGWGERVYCSTQARELGRMTSLLVESTHPRAFLAHWHQTRAGGFHVRKPTEMGRAPPRLPGGLLVGESRKMPRLADPEGEEEDQRTGKEEAGTTISATPVEQSATRNVDVNCVETGVQGIEKRDRTRALGSADGEGGGERVSEVKSLQESVINTIDRGNERGAHLDVDTLVESANASGPGKQILKVETVATWATCTGDVHVEEHAASSEKQRQSGLQAKKELQEVEQSPEEVDRQLESVKKSKRQAAKLSEDKKESEDPGKEGDGQEKGTEKSLKTCWAGKSEHSIHDTFELGEPLESLSSWGGGRVFELGLDPLSGGVDITVCHRPTKGGGREESLRITSMWGGRRCHKWEERSALPRQVTRRMARRDPWKNARQLPPRGVSHPSKGHQSTQLPRVAMSHLFAYRAQHVRTAAELWQLLRVLDHCLDRDRFVCQPTRGVVGELRGHRVAPRVGIRKEDGEGFSQEEKEERTKLVAGGMEAALEYLYHHNRRRSTLDDPRAAGKKQHFRKEAEISITEWVHEDSLDLRLIQAYRRRAIDEANAEKARVFRRRKEKAASKMRKLVAAFRIQSQQYWKGVKEDFWLLQEKIATFTGDDFSPDGATNASGGVSGIGKGESKTASTEDCVSGRLSTEVSTPIPAMSMKKSCWRTEEAVEQVVQSKEGQVLYTKARSGWLQLYEAYRKSSLAQQRKMWRLDRRPAWDIAVRARTYNGLDPQPQVEHDWQELCAKIKREVLGGEAEKRWRNHLIRNNDYYATAIQNEELKELAEKNDEN